jgi:hypothetical protein
VLAAVAPCGCVWAVFGACVSQVCGGDAHPDVVCLRSSVGVVCLSGVAQVGGRRRVSVSPAGAFCPSLRGGGSWGKGFWIKGSVLGGVVSGCPRCASLACCLLV